MSTKLIDQVLEQIQKDVAAEDLTAIEELLNYVPINILVAYLSEIDWNSSLVVLEVSRELYEQFKEQKLNDWKNYDNI